MLEMRIIFSREMTGSEPSNIICWGPVVRNADVEAPEPAPVVAAAIVKYRFEQAAGA